MHRKLKNNNLHFIVNNIHCSQCQDAMCSRCQDYRDTELDKTTKHCWHICLIHCATVCNPKCKELNCSTINTTLGDLIYPCKHSATRVGETRRVIVQSVQHRNYSLRLPFSTYEKFSVPEMIKVILRCDREWLHFTKISSTHDFIVKSISQGYALDDHVRTQNGLNRVKTKNLNKT